MSGSCVGSGGVWLLVAATHTHQASESLWAVRAELTFRTGCMVTSSVQTLTRVIAALPGRSAESQYFLELVS